MKPATQNEVNTLPALAMSEGELIDVLATSLYPGAQVSSIKMVLGYCKAAGLDPMQKPVHIVPMYDRNMGGMRDVVMPGIGLYRTQASRTGAHMGSSEPEFGPDISENIGGTDITYPKWCKVTVKRRLPTGEVAEHTATELWKENYAVRGGKEKSIAPNAMWFKRPYGQLAKCAQAQALRMAFPEIGAEATAEEMEGKTLNDTAIIDAVDPAPKIVKPKTKTETATTVEPKEVAQPKAEQASAPAAKPVNAGQLKWIEQKCKALDLVVDDVLTELQIESLDTVTPEQFDKVKSHLMAL